MTLTTLTDGEPWMTPEERELNHGLIRGIADFLAAGGVPESALVALRINEIAVTWLLARRLESALAPAEGEPPPCPTPAQAGAIGKCRERLRKAIKELETCCPKTGAPVRQGLADQMHQIIQKVRAAGFSSERTASNETAIRQTQDPTPATPSHAIPATDTPSTQRNATGESNHKARTAQTDPATPVPMPPEVLTAQGFDPVPSLQLSVPIPHDTG